ncbi:hypothetical protein [Rurimicrobium arvi]|uniref:Cytochrome c domain-containing protein n=1 Tax=Rurimicrobium arvi TaxID=2049916 RepID=A0ABP8ML09_9BACT
MKKIITLSAFSAAILLMATTGCKKSDSSSANCNTTWSFSKDIQPILAGNCTLSGCHDGSTMPLLTNYPNVKDAAAQIKSAVSSGSMPRGRSISTADKDALLCWIAAGAENN